MTDTANLPACDSPEELTPEWLSAALATAGFTTPVVGATTERVGTGQMGTSYRVTLEWADPEAAAAAGAPATVIAKMAAGPRESRGIISEGYRNELGFYTEIAHTLAVRTPHCWAAAATDDYICFTLLLEDLAPATPGDQATGLTADGGRARRGEPGRAARPPLERPRRCSRSRGSAATPPRPPTSTPRSSAARSPPSSSASRAGWPPRTRTPSGRCPTTSAPGS